MTPMEKLKQAKQMFELGYIDETMFRQLQQEALAEMGMTTSKPPVNKENPLGSNSGTIINEPNANPLGGSFGTIVNETPSNPLGANPLGGGNPLGGNAETFAGLVNGMRVGDYEIVDMLGEGGMGTVYRGRHHNEIFAKQGGDVAIKIMKPEYAQNPSFKDRFLREAGIGRRIFHKNIAPCLGFVDDGRHLALVMGFVEGKELKEMIPKGGMNLEDVIVYARQIAEALDYLHSENIVHRDIKPENIKVNAKGNLVILDMGIAKDTSTSSGTTTKTSTGMGTLPYMAPEQFRDAKSVDGKADQYALGIMVYEMICGRMPWEASTSEFDISMYKALDKLHSLKDVLEGVSDEVSGVLDRVLSSDKSKRYESCIAFIGDLEKASLGPKWLSTHWNKRFGFGEVLIPPGTFVMGSPESEKGHFSNEVQHEVTLTKGFYMMKTQVTQKLWKEITGENPSRFKGEDNPVEKVSWFDCVKAANKLSEKMGYEKVYEINGEDVKMNLKANGYRLPTEAEWEYVARGGEDFKYAGSNNLSEVAWYGYFDDDDKNRTITKEETKAVGQKKSNGYGLYDMSGNVWEWCWDWYGDYPKGSVVDPEGVENASLRVYRGGSWVLYAKFCRVANRNNGSPADRGSNLGVRFLRIQ